MSLDVLFLEYPISVRIIRSFLKESDIKTIFSRLNSNSLPLNPQELRNAVYDGEFLKLAEELADIEFWDRFQLFSNSDRRRMQDIQFISSILLFFRMGIAEDTNQENYNRIYDMFNENYEERNDDKELFLIITEQLTKLFENETLRIFFKRKTHLYTLFVLTYKLIKSNQSYSDKQIDSFSEFIKIYSLNEKELQQYMATEKINNIQEYKILSSTGTQQKSNRIMRVRLLEKIID